MVSKSSKYIWEQGTVAQIPRNSLIMLMTAFVVAVIPHIANISLWIIGAGIFCIIWRWLIFAEKIGFPSLTVKVVLILTTSLGVAFSEGITQKLETWAALLIIAFSLKLLELKTRRDAYVLTFIAYFVIAIEFIFYTSITIVFYELIAIFLVTAALVGMNQFHLRVSPLQSLKVASKLIIQAIPLMIVLFIIFPRIGPIWSIPDPGKTARIGLSSEMTPGDITNLAGSDEIVFRAIFDGPVPSQDQLYWRARVYPKFKLGTWSEQDIPKAHNNSKSSYWSKQVDTSWFVPKNKGDKKYSYSVLLEPTHNRWLFGLDLAIPKTKSTGIKWNYRIFNRDPVHQLMKYNVDSYPNAKLNTWLPEFLHEQTTTFDTNDNPRIKEFAARLFQNSDSVDDYINKVLNYIRTEPFHYTLQPPVLPRQNSIDEFWFDTKQGFCMHYAGAFIHLMRAVGIPARMVGGYQGGETNPVTEHTVVRQYMAHAWTEIWLAEIGWKRIDPTAAVAPSRIMDGLNSALQENELSALSAFTNFRLNGGIGLQKLMFYMESLEYQWNLFVIGYNSNLQTDILEKLLGKITTLRIALFILVGALLSGLFVGISLFLQNGTKPNHPVARVFQEFSNKMKKYGLEREPHETPAQFLEKLRNKYNLNKNETDSIISTINNLLYNPNVSTNDEKIRSLKQQLNSLQPKII